MPSIRSFRYRPEVDGLRAIAVLAVVLFHAGFGFPGGYVGVDVFFVISGFLITSLIWADLESGRFEFANFWERRARRIIPALVAVTAATLIAGYFLLLPPDLNNLGKASVAQSVFAANFYYWQDSGYFANDADTKPLLHIWSLAVEEQFYLFVPLLLWGLFRSVTLRSRTVVVSILAAGTILSFILSVYGVARYPWATFYLLPTRAWELSLGSLVAFLPPSLSLRRRSLRESFTLAGLTFILVPVFVYTSATPFPGLAALPPCLGAALLIWASERDDAQVPTVIGRALSASPVVAIGLISYSLYLWHWPLLVFSKYRVLTPLSSGYRLEVLGLGFLAALVSWKYVETPFRLRKLGASRASLFALAGAGLAVVLGGGLLCVSLQGSPERFSKQVQEFARARNDVSFIREFATAEVRDGKLTPIGAANPALPPRVLVWGDSHAMAAMPAVDALLKEKGIAGRAATHSATAPVLDWFQKGEGLKDDAVDFNDAVFSYVQDHQIDTVILVAAWSRYTESDDNRSGSFDAALLRTVQRLVAIGAHPWILLDVPAPNFDVPKALWLYDARAYISTSFPKLEGQNEFDNLKPDTLARIKADGGQVVDPKPRFLDPTGRQYIIQTGGVALFRDGQHLTTRGAILILLPFLRDSLTLAD